MRNSVLPPPQINMRSFVNALLPMGRLSQIFCRTSLVVGVLAGSASLLNAGGAAACTGTNGANFVLDVIVPPVSGSTTCSSPVGGFNEFVTIDTKFTPELVGPAMGNTSFKITSLQGPFLRVLLDSDFDLPSGTVTKTLWADAAFTIPILTSAPLVSTNGSSTPLIDIIGGPTEIWVKDAYEISGIFPTAGGQLDNYTNTFQTPGPLSVLGAGAAFGFSRKLRGRIKASRLG